MAISELYTGANTITSTEWSVSNVAGPTTITTDGVYQIFADVSDMISGDQLQIKIYEKARSEDTQRVIYNSYLSGPQSEPLWVSPSLILLNGWDVTFKTLAGTSINVIWSIRQVG